MKNSPAQDLADSKNSSRRGEAFGPIYNYWGGGKKKTEETNSSSSLAPEGSEALKGRHNDLGLGHFISL